MLGAAVWPAQVRGRPARINSGWRTAARPNHHGWDILVPSGTPVQAILPGRVKAARALKGAGCAVWVDHSDQDVEDELGELADVDGLSSVYMHLQGIAVELGDYISSGVVVGESGRSGKARGPHLHLGVLATAEWIARNRELLDDDEWTKATKWPGYWVDPEVFLDVDMSTELAGELAGYGFLSAAAKPKGRKVGIFGGKPPPSYKIRKWCVWQGEQRAYEILVPVGILAAVWYYSTR